MQDVPPPKHTSDQVLAVISSGYVTCGRCPTIVFHFSSDEAQPAAMDALAAHLESHHWYPNEETTT